MIPQKGLTSFSHVGDAAPLMLVERKKENTIRRYQIAVVMFIMTLLGVSNITSAKASSPDMKSLVKGNTGFALDLYSALKKEEGNLFFSPYSISAALAMTYGGARGNTEKQMEKALHLTLGWKKTHPAFAELDTRLDEAQK